MSKRTVIVSGGMLEKDFVLPILKSEDTEFVIGVDGGIYHSNVAQVLEAGANVIVSGSGVFKGDVAKNTSEFMEILRRYE